MAAESLCYIDCMIRTLLIGTAMIAAASAAAAEEPIVEVHAQATYLRQFKPPFPSPYAGQNSLGAARATSYSFTSTLYFGAKLGGGWEIYFNPEFAQGVPFSQLRGTGGFTNGELARTSGA